MRDFGWFVLAIVFTAFELAPFVFLGWCAYAFIHFVYKYW